MKRIFMIATVALSLAGCEGYGTNNGGSTQSYSYGSGGDGY